MPDLLPIQSNVVMPKKGSARPRKYPWMTMNTVCGDPPRGDSFLVECEDLPNEVKRLWNSLNSCGQWITYRTGRKFTLRRVPGGIRVWRLR